MSHNLRLEECYLAMVGMFDKDDLAAFVFLSVEPRPR